MVIDFSQYPHFLYYQETTEAVRDKFGGWIPGGLTEWKPLGRCRLEKNGQAASMPATDGKVFVFSGIIYMPRNTEIKPLPIGTKIIVSKSDLMQDGEPLDIAAAEQRGEILISTTNATFEVGRLHNRIWF